MGYRGSVLRRFIVNLFKESFWAVSFNGLNFHLVLRGRVVLWALLVCDGREGVQVLSTEGHVVQINSLLVNLFSLGVSLFLFLIISLLSNFWLLLFVEFFLSLKGNFVQKFAFFLELQVVHLNFTDILVHLDWVLFVFGIGPEVGVHHLIFMLFGFFIGSSQDYWGSGVSRRWWWQGQFSHGLLFHKLGRLESGTEINISRSLLSCFLDFGLVVLFHLCVQLLYVFASIDKSGLVECYTLRILNGIILNIISIDVFRVGVANQPTSHA